MTNKSLISVPELIMLLHDIKENRPDIAIRLRFLGEMWCNNFMNIAFVQGKSAILRDENAGKLTTIHDLSNVMQFELDHSFRGFQAFFHYEVKPIVELKTASSH